MPPSSIIRLRSRSTGLLLSELGGYLLSFDKATAGTKRISNLLRSKKWSYKLIVDHLALQAQQYVDKLLAKKEKLMLLLWDESIQEKPEYPSTPLYRIRLALTNLWNLTMNPFLQNSG